MVVSELYLRILNGDTRAIEEALVASSNDPIFNSIITDGKRAYQIAVDPKYKKIRNALIKLQRLGVYANLDTLGGSASKIVFSTTTELESEDIEKLFISYLEEEDRKDAKAEVNEDDSSVIDKVKDFYKSYHGPKRDHAEREAKENVIKSTSEISGFYKGLLTAAGTAAAIFGGVLLWKKFNNDDDSDIVIISGD